MEQAERVRKGYGDIREMKKYIKIFFTLLFTFSIIFTVTSCGSKYEYVDCDSPLTYSSDYNKYFYRPNDRSFNFNRVIEESGLSFYYESGLGGQKINHGVDAVKRVQDFCEVPQSVYLSEDTVTHVNSDGLWLNPNDNVELIGAVLLESSAETELPFGIFAGVSANLLGEDVEYSVYSESLLNSELKGYSYVKELQYPLYTERETMENERETAWNYAYKLGETYLAEYTVEELMNAAIEDISPMLEAVGATLPDYYFSVGDYLYPIQIETGYFNYYFDYAYQDRQLTQKEFSLEYKKLKDFVQENEELTSRNCTIFGLTAFPQKIDVFASDWDFPNNSDGVSYYGNNAILIKSVYVFMHEVMHHILYNSRVYGYMEEEICEYFANPSTYRQMYFFKIYKGTRVEDKYELEKKLLPPARKLYNSKYGNADISNFSIDDWFDCAAFSINKEYDKFTSYQQTTSFVKYVYEVYGLDLLKDICDDFQISNGNQTMDGLIAEWRSYLVEKYTA